MMLGIILIDFFLLANSIEISTAQVTCNQELLDRSFVTQCGPTLCEPALEPPPGTNKRPNEWPTSKDEVSHIVSSRAGDRFKVYTYKASNRVDVFYEESHPNVTVFVDTQTKYQRILGFGTTLTDASCTNTDDLSDDIRAKLINDYFSIDEGIGINLIKIPIGSTKFSYTNYVLDQPDTNQVELSPYDIDHRIPIIRDAMKAAGRFRNRVKILASSATAPPEFKDNNKMIHGGSIRHDRFSDYASYLVGFVSAYKTHGINIWSLILSESPVLVAQDQEKNDTLDHNSMAMKPSDTIKLIRAINEVREKQLSSSGNDKFRMLLLGDDKTHIPVWMDAILKSHDAVNSVAGVAYSCDNKVASYDNLAYATRRYPNKYLLATQGSINNQIRLGNWQYAENHATEIIKNLEFGSVGWIDFNMALNLEGGPIVNSKFKAEAPVMVDPKRQIYYRNPMFYAIGHLSRYVKPGSIRVKVNFYSAAHMFAHQYAAFITPDNYLVVLIMNNNIGPMPVSLGVDTKTKIETLLDTKSFNTFIFRL